MRWLHLAGIVTLGCMTSGCAGNGTPVKTPTVGPPAATAAWSDLADDTEDAVGPTVPIKAPVPKPRPSPPTTKYGSPSSRGFPNTLPTARTIPVPTRR